MQILIVDDDPAILRMVRFSLESLGHVVLVANNAAEAISCYKRGITGMVMLDIMMPGMDGLSLCRRWREEGEILPIILLTARDEQFDGEYAGAGATDWIQKPCSLRDLLAPIHQYDPAGPSPFEAGPRRPLASH